MKNFDNAAPIFLQIVESLLSDIAKGVLKPGDKVPPVRVLAAEYKVNPNTMQKSLEKLGEAGYLYTERTSGRFVTEDAAKIEELKQQIPMKMTENFVREMLDFGIPQGEINVYVERYLKEKSGKENFEQEN